MIAVWKLTFDNDALRTTLPAGAEILHVNTQKENICMWVEVDSEAPVKTRTFKIIGTGHKVPPGPRKYLGTVKLQNDTFIFHVYELLN